MSLTPPTPGLRDVHYDARSAAKVQLVIQPGDTLAVSEDVAEQLLASSPQFKTVAVEAEPPVKKPVAKKAAAKPKD